MMPHDALGLNKSTYHLHIEKQGLLLLEFGGLIPYASTNYLFDCHSFYLPLHSITVGETEAQRIYEKQYQTE